MKRHVGSLLLGLMPTIMSRGNNPCVTASERTLESNCPKVTRHFNASGRSQLSSSKALEKSFGSTMKRSVVGGACTGVHSSDKRATVRSAEEEISVFQSVSKYLIRNSLNPQCD